MGWELGLEQEPECRPPQAEGLGQELGKVLAEAQAEARVEALAEELAGVPVEAQAWEKELGLAWASPRPEECRLEEQER